MTSIMQRVHLAKLPEENIEPRIAVSVPKHEKSRTEEVLSHIVIFSLPNLTPQLTWRTCKSSLVVSHKSLSRSAVTFKTKYISYKLCPICLPITQFSRNLFEKCWNGATYIFAHTPRLTRRDYNFQSKNHRASKRILCCLISYLF